MSDYQLEVRLTLVQMQPVQPLKKFIGCAHIEVELVGDEITDEEILSAVRTLKNHPQNALSKNWSQP